MSIPRRVGVPASKPAPQVSDPTPIPEPAPVPTSRDISSTVLDRTAVANLPPHMRALWETAEGYGQELFDDLEKWPEAERDLGRLVVQAAVIGATLDDAAKDRLGADILRRIAKSQEQVSPVDPVQEAVAEEPKPFSYAGAAFTGDPYDLDAQDLAGGATEHPKVRDGATVHAELEQQKALKSKRGGR